MQAGQEVNLRRRKGKVLSWENMRLGFVGLGKMGKGMVLRLLEAKMEVVVWNRSTEDYLDVTPFGAIAADSLKDLVSKVAQPRIIWLMLPEGPPVDQILEQLVVHLNPGDLVVEGGNSFYKDTLRRADQLKKKNIEFMDVGVSGGPKGARNGACLMAGGTTENFNRVKPILDALAAPAASSHLGPIGSGHFAKMVHNGIEYGMMEALAEGLTVLKYSPFGYNLAEVLRLYNQRSVIESRLVGWAEEALRKDPELFQISDRIGATGEGRWTVETAEELDIEVPVIKDSLQVREESALGVLKEKQSFRNRVVSALRGKFGQHPVGTPEK